MPVPDWLPPNLPDAIEYYNKALNIECTPEEFNAVERELILGDLFYLLVFGCGRSDLMHPWLFARCREVQMDPDGHIDLWARDHYKMLTLDYPVMTPYGFVNHGDLRIGDTVFGPDGKTTRVIATTPIFYDGEAFEIEFYDGTKIKAGANHLWKVERRTYKRIKGTFSHDGIGKRQYRENVMMTTKEIFSHNHSPDKRLSITVTEALDFPEAELTIAPYLLGCWLGDGTSADGRITCGDDIWSEINKTDSMGRDMTPNRNSSYHKIDNLSFRLRILGLIKNKHIPEEYMLSSKSQRLALLQGLMDTDGYCDTRGTATFVNINRNLAEGIYKIISSLGMKPHMRAVSGNFNGMPYPYFQVSFQAHKELPPFRLQRKAQRCIKRPKKLRHYIIACRPINSEPMSCIQVDRDDGMYLVGHNLIPTHNSSIITFAQTIQDILNDPEVTFGFFSHTRPIAKGFMRQIKRELENNRRLQELFPDILYADPQKEATTWSEDSGLIVKRKGNPKEATLEAWGLVESQPTSKHFKKRVYDDVVTPESVSSPEQIQKTTDAMDMSSNLGTKGGVARMIGTRYALGDTYDEYLKRGLMKPRIHAATDDGTVDGNPVFLSDEQWDKKINEMSSAILASQMLQNPLAKDSIIFQSEWFQIWPAWIEVDSPRGGGKVLKRNPLPDFEAVYLSLDGAVKKTETADDSCILALGLFRPFEGSQKYAVFILDCIMDKFSYPELRKEAIKMYESKFGASDKIVDGIIIEDKSSGSSLIDDLGTSNFSVIPYKPGGLDKIARANIQSPLVKQGCVYIPESNNPKRRGHPMNWLSKWWTQIQYFPNVKHDDGVDTLTQALAVLRKMGFLQPEAVTEAPQSYWHRLQTGSYSGDRTHRTT